MNKVTKLFDAMPPEALAALSVTAQFQKDLDTMERIRQAVPRKSYLMSDARYVGAREHLETAIFTLAVDFWRNTAYMLVCQLKLKDALDEEMSREAIMNVIDKADRYQQWRQVFSHVCHVLCSESGLDEPTIRKFVGFEDGLPTELDLDSLDETDKADAEDVINAFRYAATGNPRFSQ